jgi:hypothetical protein
MINQELNNEVQAIKIQMLTGLGLRTKVQAPLLVAASFEIALIALEEVREKFGHEISKEIAEAAIEELEIFTGKRKLVKF